MKQIMITSNSSKGENIFHCWNATQSFYVFTQRGKLGIDAAYSDLKALPNITMSICHCAPKSQITAFYK